MQRFFEFRAWGNTGRVPEDGAFATALHALMVGHGLQRANADLVQGGGVPSAFSTFRAWGQTGRAPPAGTFATALTNLMAQHAVDWVVAERTGGA